MARWLRRRECQVMRMQQVRLSPFTAIGASLPGVHRLESPACHVPCVRYLASLYLASFLYTTSGLVRNPQIKHKPTVLTVGRILCQYAVIRPSVGGGIMIRRVIPCFTPFCRPCVLPADHLVLLLQWITPIMIIIVIIITVSTSWSCCHSCGSCCMTQHLLKN